VSTLQSTPRSSTDQVVGALGILYEVKGD
jgi:hypothetical protein